MRTTDTLFRLTQAARIWVAVRNRGPIRHRVDGPRRRHAAWPGRPPRALPPVAPTPERAPPRAPGGLRPLPFFRTWLPARPPAIAVVRAGTPSPPSALHTRLPALCSARLRCAQQSGAFACGPAGPRLRPLPPLRGRARTSPACGLPILGPAAAASRCAITRWPEHFPPPPGGAALESPRPGPTLARLLFACPCSVTIRCRHFCKAVFYAVESQKPPICRRLANRRSPPARRLRPAGLRTASHRLSRRSSALERTMEPFFQNLLLSGAAGPPQPQRLAGPAGIRPSSVPDAKAKRAFCHSYKKPLLRLLAALAI